MDNPYLFQNEEETIAPPPGVLIAGRFRRPYGFQGHRSKGTKDWLMIYTVSGEGSFWAKKEIRRAADFVFCLLEYCTIMPPIKGANGRS